MTNRVANTVLALALLGARGLAQDQGQSRTVASASNSHRTGVGLTPSFGFDRGNVPRTVAAFENGHAFSSTVGGRNYQLESRYEQLMYWKEPFVVRCDVRASEDPWLHWRS